MREEKIFRIFSLDQEYKKFRTEEAIKELEEEYRNEKVRSIVSR